MWVFCKEGFFSAVEHLGDKSKILLRARLKGDLERLFAKNGIDAEVEATPEADYAFRATISKSDWTKVMAATAADIDYCNFKDRVHERSCGIRNDAYMNIWCDIREAQEKARRTNAYPLKDKK